MQQHGDIAGFIADVRAAIIGQNPARADLFDTYANEARFGFSIIADDVRSLAHDAVVLEIGAGTFLLSGYLAHRGLRVHALEPTAPGFSHFAELQHDVMKHYERMSLALHWICAPIEGFSEAESFDYVYSINVFEHVEDVDLALSNAYLSLKQGAHLRIYCPNYRFPYEPHFNIPTLVNKRLTQYVLGSAIFASTRVSDPRQFWDSLNWIDVRRVRRLFHDRFGAEPSFDRLATYGIVTRMFEDSYFSARRSKWMSASLKALGRLGLLRLFRFVPVALAPVMDFIIQRRRTPA